MLQPWTLQRRRHGRRRRLLPGALDGPRRRRRLSLQGRRGRARLRRDGGTRGRRAASCTSAGSANQPKSKHLRSRHETAQVLARRAAADLLPRRDGGRRAERVLPHAALPGRAAAGDDRSRRGSRPRRSRSRSTTCSPTWSRRRRCPRPPGARSRSAAPTCSPTATCSTAWPTCSAAAAARSCRCRS